MAEGQDQLVLPLGRFSPDGLWLAADRLWQRGSEWDCPPRTVAVLPKLPAILPRLRSGQPHPLAHTNRRTTDRARVPPHVAISARAHTPQRPQRVPRSSHTRNRAHTRRQRGDGPGSGARAEAMLPSCIGSIALVARKTSGGSARVSPGAERPRASRRVNAEWFSVRVAGRKPSHERERTRFGVDSGWTGGGPRRGRGSGCVLRNAIRLSYSRPRVWARPTALTEDSRPRSSPSFR